MSKPTRAIIRWIPSERGGRARPRTHAEGYATIARFESDVNGTQGTWTVRLSDISLLHKDQCIRATLDFASPDAPRQLLASGERFELLEGPRVVAKGVVVPSELPVPDQLSEFDLALLG